MLFIMSPNPWARTPPKPQDGVSHRHAARNHSHEAEVLAFNLNHALKNCHWSDRHQRHHFLLAFETAPPSKPQVFISLELGDVDKRPKVFQVHRLTILVGFLAFLLGRFCCGEFIQQEDQVFGCSDVAFWCFFAMRNLQLYLGQRRNTGTLTISFTMMR